MQLPTKNVKECWRAIGQYYAYGECIECRAATLTGFRPHIEFYNCVYSYVNQLFTANENPVILKEYEEKMWKFACIAQDSYFAALRDVVGIDKAKTYNGNRFSSIDPDGDPPICDLERLKTGYQELVEIDGHRCVFAEKLENRIPNVYAFPPDTLTAIASLLRDLNRTICVREKYIALADSTLSKKDAKPRSPISVYVSMFVFVSHLGRAVSWFTDTNIDTAYKELKNSIPHLHRATMDANKLLIECILEKRFEKEKQDLGFRSETFYLGLMEARKHEHDRLTHTNEEFDMREKKYKEFLLYPAEALITKLS